MRPYKIYLPFDQQPILYRIPALLLSYAFGLLIFIRNGLYDSGVLSSFRLPGFCISVGNLTVGGTGKSPFVMELVQKLTNLGHKAAILTRGYGSSLRKGDTLVLLGGKVFAKNFSNEPLQIPDEALMQSQKNPTVPIVVGRCRRKSALWFLNNTDGKPTHWILDDGFQHRKIHRDIDVVLLDAQNPLGNGLLLPAGSLREPRRNLKRAHLVCFTRADERLPSIEMESSLKPFSSSPFFKLRFDISLRPTQKTKSLDANCQPALLMLGIAQPERLLAQIKKTSIPIGASYFVEDHQPFSKDEMLRQMGSCKSIVTTEKDYWRNPSIFVDSGKPYFIIDLNLFPMDGEKDSIFEKISQS